MSNPRTLTSANSVITLAIAGLYSSPRQLQGFSTDNVFDTEALTNGELQMGVDGRLSAGWVANPVVMNITLQADSLSNDIFDRWWSAEQTLREKMPATGVVILPALLSKFNLVRGFLTSFPPTPTAGRTLQPRRFTLSWESFTKAPT